MTEAFRARVEKAAASVASLPRVEAGVILGSGLGDLVESLNGQVVDYGDIEGFPVPSVAGHRGSLKVVDAGAGKTGVALMAGRFHFYEGWTMDDLVMPVFLLARLGVQKIIVTNAAGAVNQDYKPGDLVLIKDHINLIGTNPLIGPVVTDWGPRFPDMSQAYDPSLRALAQQAAGAPLAEGVYAALSGPTYETPAEIRMLRALGADLVGMSTVPEVIAANFLGLQALGVSCVTNMAAGILDQPLNHQEVIETGKRVAKDFAHLILSFLSLL